MTADPDTLVSDLVAGIRDACAGVPAGVTLDTEIDGYPVHVEHHHRAPRVRVRVEFGPVEINSVGDTAEQAARGLESVVSQLAAPAAAA